MQFLESWQPGKRWHEPKEGSCKELGNPSAPSRLMGADEAVVAMKWWKHHRAKGGTPGREIKLKTKRHGRNQQLEKEGLKKLMSGQIYITKEEVVTAWEAVRQAGGGAGIDRKGIEDIKVDLENQLYKIQNRMSAGSYMAQAVKLVQIPKAKGGFRTLGVPNVTDRIAQTVIKNRLERTLEPQFHEDSHAYRPYRGAIDAVMKCRERCFRREWVIEVDIKGFFDAIDHEIMMDILREYEKDRAVLLYAERFLKAKGVKEDGEEVIRDKGTPQGGVVSPVLANLYLHEAFDKWMAEEFSDIQFERYADDIIMHCVSEKQAKFLKDKVEQRLKQYNLELHPEKTRIVYTGTRNDHDNRGRKLSRKFTFLGYDFKPRRLRNGRIGFTPGMSMGALKRIGQTMQEKWHLHRRTWLKIEEVAEEVNPKIQGWIKYYGHFRRSELYRLARKIDGNLARFLKRKCKNIRSIKQGWKELQRIQKETPTLFGHWYMICQGRRAV